MVSELSSLDHSKDRDESDDDASSSCVSVRSGLLDGVERSSDRPSSEGPSEGSSVEVREAESEKEEQGRAAQLPFYYYGESAAFDESGNSKVLRNRNSHVRWSLQGGTADGLADLSGYDSRVRSSADRMADPVIQMRVEPKSSAVTNLNVSTNRNLNLRDNRIEGGVAVRVANRNSMVCSESEDNSGSSSQKADVPYRSPPVRSPDPLLQGFYPSTSAAALQKREYMTDVWKQASKDLPSTDNERKFDLLPDHIGHRDFWNDDPGQQYLPPVSPPRAVWADQTLRSVRNRINGTTDAPRSPARSPNRVIEIQQAPLVVQIEDDNQVQFENLMTKSEFYAEMTRLQDELRRRDEQELIVSIKRGSTSFMQENVVLRTGHGLDSRPMKNPFVPDGSESINKLQNFSKVIEQPRNRVPNQIPAELMDNPVGNNTAHLSGPFQNVLLSGNGVVQRQPVLQKQVRKVKQALGLKQKKDPAMGRNSNVRWSEAVVGSMEFSSENEDHQRLLNYGAEQAGHTRNEDQTAAEQTCDPSSAAELLGYAQRSASSQHGSPKEGAADSKSTPARFYAETEKTSSCASVDGGRGFEDESERRDFLGVTRFDVRNNNDVREQRADSMGSEEQRTEEDSSFVEATGGFDRRSSDSHGSTVHFVNQIDSQFAGSAMASDYGWSRTSSSQSSGTSIPGRKKLRFSNEAEARTSQAEITTQRQPSANSPSEGGLINRASSVTTSLKSLEKVGNEQRHEGDLIVSREESATLSKCMRLLQGIGDHSAHVLTAPVSDLNEVGNILAGDAVSEASHPFYFYTENTKEFALPVVREEHSETYSMDHHRSKEVRLPDDSSEIYEEEEEEEEYHFEGTDIGEKKVRLMLGKAREELEDNFSEREKPMQAGNPHQVSSSEEEEDDELLQLAEKSVEAEHETIRLEKEAEEKKKHEEREAAQKKAALSLKKLDEKEHELLAEERHRHEQEGFVYAHHEAAEASAVEDAVPQYCDTKIFPPPENCHLHAEETEETAFKLAKRWTEIAVGMNDVFQRETSFSPRVWTKDRHHQHDGAESTGNAPDGRVSAPYHPQQPQPLARHHVENNSAVAANDDPSSAKYYWASNALTFRQERNAIQEKRHRSRSAAGASSADNVNSDKSLNDKTYDKTANQQHLFYTTAESGIESFSHQDERRLSPRAVRRKRERIFRHNRDVMSIVVDPERDCVYKSGVERRAEKKSRGKNSPGRTNQFLSFSKTSVDGSKETIATVAAIAGRGRKRNKFLRRDMPFVTTREGVGSLKSSKLSSAFEEVFPWACNAPNG